jgi:hypothetical protein
VVDLAGKSHELLEQLSRAAEVVEPAVLDLDEAHGVLDGLAVAAVGEHPPLAVVGLDRGG